MEEKSKIQQALEKQFEELLAQINERFGQAGDQMAGLSKWMQAQLQIITNNIRKTEISQSVLDVTSTALLELIVKKGLVTEEEYKQTIEEVMKRKTLDAPKSPLK